MPHANDVEARVRKVLVQALAVEEDAITPSATLQGDLGAESIDFLDIVFRLEREFTIRIPRGELFSELLFKDAAELSTLERDRRLKRINDLFTVDLLSSYVAWRLGGNVDADSDLQSAGTLISARI
jgi:acyl carrier protein